LVRHKSSWGGWEVYGVEFTDLTAEHRLEIAAYVEQMLDIGRKA